MNLTGLSRSAEDGAYRSLINQSSQPVYELSDAFLPPHVCLFWCVSIFPILWSTAEVYSRLCVTGAVCGVSSAGLGSSWDDATRSYQLQFMFGAAACQRFGAIFDTKGRFVPEITSKDLRLQISERCFTDYFFRFTCMTDVEASEIDPVKLLHKHS